MNELSAHEQFEQMIDRKYPGLVADSFAGFEIDAGWYDIVDILFDLIWSYQETVTKYRNSCIERGEVPPSDIERVVIQQVKEKFGGLRVYYDGGDQYVRGLVMMAECWAARSCEVCGQRGRLRSGRWMRTLCNQHDSKHGGIYSDIVSDGGLDPRG